MFGWFTYDFAKDFQSVGVGIVGFTGVIVTLVVNAWLTRNQHERGVRHERALIRRATLVELRRYRESAEANIKHIDGLNDDGGLLMPTHPTIPVYDNHFDRIVHLSESEIDAVLDAYSKIKSLPEIIKLALKLSVPRENQIENEDIVGVDPRLVPLCRGVVEKSLEATNKAIATLEAGR